MQPLSYQATGVTCWVTSMLNAILLFRESDEIPFHVCRELYGLVPDHGPDDYANQGVFYYENEDLEKYETAIERAGKYANLNITYKKDDAVQSAIQNLDFSCQVAICDVHDGWHSILLVGKKDDLYYGFDPCWSYVSPKEKNQQL